MGDIIVMIVLAVWLFAAARSLLRARAKGGCSGCSGCSGNCSRCSHATRN